MTAQRLHSALAPIDVLTRIELDESLNRGFSAAERTRLLGLDSIRLPRMLQTAQSATIQLFASANESPAGPSEGDVWMIRRIIVKSSSLVDTAKYVLYRGSTPSDINSQYGMTQLLECGVGGATPGFNVNVGFYPSQKAVLLQPGEQIYAQVFSATNGNQYQLDGEGIRVPAEMKGKVL